MRAWRFSTAVCEECVIRLAPPSIRGGPPSLCANADRRQGMMRREFLEHVATAAIASNVRGVPRPFNQGSPEVWRAAFPALRQEINGKPLTYLDSAATTLRPQPMIDALSAFYARENANP